MPTWIIVLIGLLIIGVILDGIRRMRIRRYESIRISKRAKLADKELEELKHDDLIDHGSDFPSGGARVISKKGKQHAEQTTEQPQTQSENRLPEQVTLNLEETVPMLMEPIESDQKASITHENEGLGILAVTPGDEAINQEDEREPALGTLDDIDSIDDEPIVIQASHSTESKIKEPKVKQEKPQNKPQEIKSKEPEEVIIINIMAKSGILFSGDYLLEAFMENHLKFGDMDIFHRHVEENGEGNTIFSLANMVVPGTFNLATIHTFQSPGISLFMTLPVDMESLPAFNLMVDTARSIAHRIDGELKDENRSVMTNQTIEHARQKVLEYERKRKLHAR